MNKSEFESALECLLKDSKDKSIIVIGESHEDENILDIVLPLMDRSDLKYLFLEAVMRGNAASKRGLGLRTGDAYKWNPQKYDFLIKRGQQAGLQVHGIDDENECGADRVASWLDYLAALPTGKALILTGAAHVNFWHGKTISTISLPRHLTERGVSQERLLTITSVDRGRNEPYGLYKVNDIPDDTVLSFYKRPRIADYVFLYGYGLWDDHQYAMNADTY